MVNVVLGDVRKLLGHVRGVLGDAHVAGENDYQIRSVAPDAGNGARFITSVLKELSMLERYHQAGGALYANPTQTLAEHIKTSHIVIPNGNEHTGKWVSTYIGGIHDRYIAKLSHVLIFHGIWQIIEDETDIELIRVVSAGDDKITITIPFFSEDYLSCYKRASTFGSLKSTDVYAHQFFHEAHGRRRAVDAEDLFNTAPQAGQTAAAAMAPRQYREIQSIKIFLKLSGGLYKIFSTMPFFNYLA